MPRPRKMRSVFGEPGATYFKPRGIPMTELEETVLSVEEVEALRLINMDGLEQGEAAKKMEVSQPTLSRILKSARKKLTDALVNGKAIKIEGGSYVMKRKKI